MGTNMTTGEGIPAAGTADSESAASRRRAPHPSRAARGRGATAAQSIYQQLRAEIMTLKRKPGEPVIEKDLLQTYGVSRTPVREAVRQLAGEGLLEVFPQSGTFVARIPLSNLPESMRIRTALEETTARYAAQRATPQQVAGLEDLIARQRVAAEAGDAEAFHRADEEFHSAIADVAGLPGVWTLIQQVKVQIDRYRRLTLPDPGRMVRLVDEHAAAVTAIAEHRPDAAEAAIKLHLEKLAAEFGERSKQLPDYFIADL